MISLQSSTADLRDDGFIKLNSLISDKKSVTFEGTSVKFKNTESPRDATPHRNTNLPPAARDHEEETYFLIRAYKSREALEQEQAVFYGSDDWRFGPRRELVDRIQTYVNTLIWVSESAVISMKELNKSTNVGL